MRQIYGANIKEQDFTKQDFGFGDPHCMKSEKTFLKDLINKNMKHIPKKYFPFDLNNKENILYREIIAVY